MTEQENPRQRAGCLAFATVISAVAAVVLLLVWYIGGRPHRWLVLERPIDLDEGQTFHADFRPEPGVHYWILLVTDRTLDFDEQVALLGISDEPEDLERCEVGFRWSVSKRGKVLQSGKNIGTGGGGFSDTLERFVGTFQATSGGRHEIRGEPLRSSPRLQQTQPRICIYPDQVLYKGHWIVWSLIGTLLIGGAFATGLIALLLGGILIANARESLAVRRAALHDEG